MDREDSNFQVECNNIVLSWEGEGHAQLECSQDKNPLTSNNDENNKNNINAFWLWQEILRSMRVEPEPPMAHETTLIFGDAAGKMSSLEQAEREEGIGSFFTPHPSNHHRRRNFFEG